MFVFRMFLVPYLMTLIVELLIGLLWGCRSWRDILTIFWVNTITNPAVTAIRYFSNQHIVSADLRQWILYGAEILVLLLEWRLFRRFINGRGGKHPFLMSLTLNAASYTAGLFAPYAFLMLSGRM